MTRKLTEEDIDVGYMSTTREFVVAIFEVMHRSSCIGSGAEAGGVAYNVYAKMLWP
jgi:hypothetical protein